MYLFFLYTLYFLHSHPFCDHPAMLATENFLVFLEKCVDPSGTHEVVVCGTVGRAATHSGANFMAEITFLNEDDKHKYNMKGLLD